MYIGIIMSISWASSTCVFFISLMQSLNRAQFSKITLLLVLFTGAAASAVFGTVIVGLTCIYSSL